MTGPGSRAVRRSQVSECRRPGPPVRSRPAAVEGFLVSLVAAAAALVFLVGLPLLAEFAVWVTR